jgi:hypothetical protein
LLGINDSSYLVNQPGEAFHSLTYFSVPLSLRGHNVVYLYLLALHLPLPVLFSRDVNVFEG